VATTAVENYLKAIIGLCPSPRGPAAPLGELARRLDVTPGTVTTMMKQLDRQRLVRYEPRRGVKLTARGRREAAQVLRRHRLIETFLVQVMGLDWTQVHREAEVLEHAVSDTLLERMDQLLGHPTHDPHGDPIPDADGEWAERSLTPLRDLASDHAIVARVSDSDPALLDLLDRHGLTPGTPLHVMARDPAGDTITVTPAPAPGSARGTQTRTGRRRPRPVTLGGTAAARVLVDPAEATGESPG
jgi:DtxR family Mn-dependent transcriptional regulator